MLNNDNNTNIAGVILYKELMNDYLIAIQKFNLISIFITFIIENIAMIMYFYTKTNEVSKGLYFLLYVLRPTLLSIILYFVFCRIISKIYMIKDKINDAIFIQFCYMSFVTSIWVWTHYIFPVMYLLPAIPLVFSIFFESKEVSFKKYLITNISLSIAFLLTAFDKYIVPPKNFILNVIITYVILGMTEIIIQIILKFELKKHAILDSSFKYAQMMENKSNHDQLTKLYNHETFVSQLVYYMEKWKTNDIHSLHLCMIDIDKFKQVNDTYGHEFGNVVLKRLSKKLLSISNNSTIVARYGGEEFCVLFIDYMLPDVQKILENLKTSFTEVSYREPYKGTFSAGIAEYNGTTDMSEFIQESDEALYYSKHNGRNQINIYDPNIIYAKK